VGGRVEPFVIHMEEGERCAAPGTCENNWGGCSLPFGTKG